MKRGRVTMVLRVGLSHSQRDLVAQEVGIMNQVSYFSPLSTFFINEVKDTNYKSVQQQISFPFLGPKTLLMSGNARDDKNDRFGERAPQLTMLAKLAILANFVELVKSSIGIDSSWVNIGDFGEIDKIGNFGNILPISLN